MLVVRLRVELQVAHVLQQPDELLRDLVAERFGGGHEFFVEYLFVLFLFVLGVHVLPGQLSEEEVDEHVEHALEVVPPALLDAEVRVDGGVAGGAGEVLVVLVGDVAAVELVLLGESEVDDEDGGALAVPADEEVVGLDVAVDETLGMDVLDPLQDLQADHDDGLQRKTLVELLEQRLQRLPQHLHYHHALLALSEILVDLAEKGATLRMPRSCERPSLSKICRILD